MSNVLNALLARAADSFERREEEDALERLLEAWRESRAEPIAGLARWLSDRLAARVAPIDFHSFSPPLETPRSVDLPQVLGDLQESAAQGKEAALCHALSMLRYWPADPRISPGLLTLARLPVVRNDDVLRELCNVLMRLKDPHLEQSLRELRASLPPGLPSIEWLDFAIRAAASQASKVLDEETQARCDALKEAIVDRAAAEQRTAALREVLQARVYASPDDDSARLILADVLLEQGDPLGELIILQSGPAPDEARVTQLLAANRMWWEAPLGAAIERGRTRFERGFPVAVRMRSHLGPVLPEPGPAWATVREIDWRGYHPSSDSATWLAHPHLRGVTRLRHVSDTLAPQLGQHPLPVQRLELDGEMLPRWTLELFSSLAALPKLAWVELPRAAPRDVAACASSRLAQRIERFEASVSGAWMLEVTPRAEVPIRATLVSERQCAALAEALQGAVGFSTRGLFIRCLRKPDAAGMDALKAAASAYARVDWDTAR